MDQRLFQEAAGLPWARHDGAMYGKKRNALKTSAIPQPINEAPSDANIVPPPMPEMKRNDQSSSSSSSSSSDGPQDPTTSTKLEPGPKSDNTGIVQSASSSAPADSSMDVGITGKRAMIADGQSLGWQPEVEDGVKRWKKVQKIVNDRTDEMSEPKRWRQHPRSFTSTQLKMRETI